MVKTALAMTGFQVDEKSASLIQDVIHALIQKQTDYSIEDATRILYEHTVQKETVKDSDELIKLKERYSVLSSLDEPSSKSKKQLQISDMIDKTLNQLEKLQHGT